MARNKPTHPAGLAAAVVESMGIELCRIILDSNSPARLKTMGLRLKA
ncbi:hypothetical protein COLO4_31964 [Corchorus olitorius]|uniref:Uncharacterized protein n=1 Tax=Corchorus olitorius TaxID=93759 RepID=A0A1R3H2U5_9ROSI|nr:hypothetical protein COLO4_31964 [Corchorus olitorius]